MPYRLRYLDDIFVVDTDTVKDYFNRYKQLGKDNFYQLHYCGKEPYLTKEQQEQFGKYVDEHFNLRSIDFAVILRTFWISPFQIEGDSGAKFLQSDSHNAVGVACEYPRCNRGKAAAIETRTL